MPSVTGPDGRKLNFPEGTDQQAVLRVLQQQYPDAEWGQQPQESKQQKPDFSNVSGSMSKTVAATKPRNGLTNFADAAQHHLMAAPIGIAQLAAHGVNVGIQAAAGGTDYAKGVQGRLDATDQGIQKREADYQQRTPDGAASYAGAAVGEIAPWMTGMGQLRALGLLPKIEAAGKVALLKKGGLLAAEGGAMGAAQPVTGEGGYAGQKGLQVGLGAAAAPVMAGSVALAGKGASMSRYLTSGGRDAIANERLAKLYGVEPAAITQLRNGVGIPGYNLTPAQALATPEAVQAERLMRNGPQTGAAFAQREGQNNQALRQQAERLAGTDADMSAARKARSAATDPYYAQLEGQRVDPADVVAALDQLGASGLGTRTKVSGAVASLKNEIKGRIGPDGKIDAGVLSALRENVSSHLGDFPKAQEKKALVPIKDTIADALDRAVPGYRANLAAYASGSQPISDMQAGRTLLGAIDSGGRDATGNQSVSLTQLKTMLSRDNKSRYPMSKQARQQAEAMLEALQRRSVTNNNIAAAGPGTAADLIRGGGQSPALQRGLAALLAGGGMAAGGPVAGLGAYLASEGAQAANNGVLRRMGAKAADAGATADAIEAYRRALLQKQNSPQSRLTNLMLPYRP